MGEGAGGGEVGVGGAGGDIIAVVLQQQKQASIKPLVEG